MTWEYRIPTLADAPGRLLLQDKRSVYVYEDDQLNGVPRVSIYCAGEMLVDSEEESHAGEPWLFGSLEPVYEWLEQTGGELRWGWSYYYPTGDGHAILLSQTRARQTVKRLIGNDVIDDNPIHDGAVVRTKYPFHCGNCGLSRTWRDDSIQGAASLLSAVGRREVSLLGLVRVVSGLARATGC